MEGNKEESLRCRDIGSEALRKGQNERAVKMFKKSLHLYPLPGVKALLSQAERRLADKQNGESSSTNAARTYSNGDTTNGYSNVRPASSATSSTASASASLNGRSYTDSQVEIVQKVLRAKDGGRGAHYRVLELDQNCDEAAIKKAYRKLALKLHPDKNSAPHADEAFKAVGLAYATLSDNQKRSVYDRYGDEDPDNRGGGRGGRAGNMHFHGQDVSPEDIFNMFFGGGMHPGAAGGQGFRVYSTGFGPGFAFGGMHPNMAQARARAQERQQRDNGDLGNFLQYVPLLIIFLLSFFNIPGDDGTGATGGSRYFSLTPAPPFTNPLSTKLTKVKDIPYFVSDKFLRTYYRDKYQLSRVEQLVEKSYERYLVEECKNQRALKHKMEAEQKKISPAKTISEFQLTRCVELMDLFPQAVPREKKSRHTEF